MAEVRIRFETIARGWAVVSITVDDDRLSELIDLDYGHDRWCLPTSYQPPAGELDNHP